MDLDDEGQNQMGTLEALIRQNNGVVDATLDEHGKQNGKMTPKTNYLVLGAEPKGELLQPFTRMVADAEHLNIPKLQLADLKQKMGYKRTASIERFGRPAPPDAPKTGAGKGAGKRRPAKTADAADDNK
jgi:hypothetical protein